MHDALIAHEPTPSASQLVLLFHGVGSGPEDLLPLGQAVGHRFPDALVLSARSPDASDLGNGWQWFSVRGIEDAIRPLRVAEAMPRFLATVQHWQHESGLDAAATTLIGFSQGAIMALEATQRPQPLAARVIAIAGRFAQPPRLAPPATALHLLHGEEDRVVPSALSVEGAQQLQALGATATLDVFPRLGHGIDARVLERIIQRMHDRATS